MRLKGTVIRGAGQAGENFGIKTANLNLNDLSKSGVYVVKVSHEGRIYKGICFIGKAYLLKDEPTRVEAHLFDYDSDLLGKEIEIELIKKLRDSVKFKNDEQAKEYIMKDVKQAKEFFK